MGKVSTAAGPVVKVHDGQCLDEVKKLIGKLFKVDPTKAGKITYEEPPAGESPNSMARIPYRSNFHLKLTTRGATITSDQAWQSSVRDWVKLRESRGSKVLQREMKECAKQMDANSLPLDQRTGAEVVWNLGIRAMNCKEMKPNMLMPLTQLLQSPDLDVQIDALGALWMICVGRNTLDQRARTIVRVKLARLGLVETLISLLVRT
jgi:hypothetical protein